MVKRPKKSPPVSNEDAIMTNTAVVNMEVGQEAEEEGFEEKEGGELTLF